MYSANIKGIK